MLRVSGKLLWCVKFLCRSICLIGSVDAIKIECNEIIATAVPEMYGYPYGNLSAFNASNGKLLWFFTIHNMSPEPTYMSLDYICINNGCAVASAGNANGG